jgi:SAM-dependent methyltransferase
MNHESFYPSIWLSSFASKQSFDANSTRLHELFGVLDGIDDRMLPSRHPTSLQAHCTACDKATAMRLTWHYCAANAEGSVHPAWTETAVCQECGLNSRMRALIDFLRQLRAGENGTRFKRVYCAERTTPSYPVVKRLFAEVTGSEYLGPDKTPGQKSLLVKGHPQLVRHEDLTRLSFADRGFDLVVTQDVFEHVPDYPQAFRECARVLDHAGMLVFTIPFFFDQQATRIRASIRADGNIEHHLPPEFHGNPVSNEGSLCFQNFGWDVLDTLNANGFMEAKASLYWGPWQGHLGFPFFVFSAVKRS